jgi:sialate O-acetylesterase
MVAPIRSYGLRGAVWYQGESNDDAPEQYEGLLRGLVADWRAAFGADLPFLVVQLPNWGAAPTAPTAASWATLRDDQRRAVAHVAHAGLAVTIDVGDRADLHPANKQAVGRRLARAARHVVYGEAVTPSGPVVLGAAREGERVVVSFGDIEKALVTYSAGHAWGFELCGAEQPSCRFVPGVVSGSQVMLDAHAAPEATRVRFCWGAGPVCNLYDDGPGLPAGPFEIEIR